MTKIYENAKEALDGILFDGMTIMSGGFGVCGIPEHAILAIRDSGVRDLTVISNHCGIDDFGLGILLETNQISKMILSYVGKNKLFESHLLSRKLEAEFNPQGTLAERIRAGGAGIPAFFTKSGAETVISEGKEKRIFNGETCVMETALTADLSITKAHIADEAGNLTFRKTARNFNPIMAMAGKVSFVEVEEIVKEGEINPDHIHLPGIFTHRLIKGHDFEKKIERLATRQRV